VIRIAIVIAVDEMRSRFSQVTSSIGRSHIAQKDCRQGVLPFTSTNLMRRPPRRIGWVEDIGRRSADVISAIWIVPFR
jgi:hypothetical protein